MTEKKCGKCQLVQSLSNFYKHRDRRDGFQSSCKPCVLARNKELYSKEYHQAYYLKNKEKYTASSKAWKIENKVRHDAHRIKYNEKRRQKYAEAKLARTTPPPEST